MLIISIYLRNVQVKPYLSKSSKTNKIDQGLSFATVQAKWASRSTNTRSPPHPTCTQIINHLNPSFNSLKPTRNPDIDWAFLFKLLGELNYVSSTFWHNSCRTIRHKTWVLTSSNYFKISILTMCPEVNTESRTGYRKNAM